MSNFLGTSSNEERPRIISAALLLAREGVDLHKGMNFRVKGPLPSVFLVLPHEGKFRDEWNQEASLYIYEGHDSETVEGGKLTDQVLMYPSGTLSDNGKFYKAAYAYKDGDRKEPLSIQVYEKLDPGVWFDKGIFHLIDAKQVAESGRTVFKFSLEPLRGGESSEDFNERMISASAKASAWTRGEGRCAECGSEADLHMVQSGDQAQLLCGLHSGRGTRGLI